MLASSVGMDVIDGVGDHDLRPVLTYQLVNCGGIHNVPEFEFDAEDLGAGSCFSIAHLIVSIDRTDHRSVAGVQGERAPGPQLRIIRVGHDG